MASDAQNGTVTEIQEGILPPFLRQHSPDLVQGIPLAESSGIKQYVICCKRDRACPGRQGICRTHIASGQDSYIEIAGSTFPESLTELEQGKHLIIHRHRGVRPG